MFLTSTCLNYSGKAYVFRFTVNMESFFYKYFGLSLLKVTITVGEKEKEIL